MLVGRGMVASKFAKYSGSPDVTIFASGVSNSAETDASPFAREAALLKQTVRSAPLFVYFSSLFDAGKAASPYAQHKRAMENLAANESESHLIFRMPQVLGATSNSTNLVGFFVRQLQSGGAFRVQAHATRVLIDIDDVGLICDHFIACPSLWNRFVHLAPPPAIPVPQIVAKLEQLLDKKGNYEVVDEGVPFTDVSTDIEPLAVKLGLEFGADYCWRVLEKYYG